MKQFLREKLKKNETRGDNAIIDIKRRRTITSAWWTLAESDTIRNKSIAVNFP